MENRNGLVVDGCVTPANGTAERDAAMAMVDWVKTDGPITLGADKGGAAAEFIERLETARVVPHVAQSKKGRPSAVPNRVARTPGYLVRIPKLVDTGGREWCLCCAVKGPEMGKNSK